MTVTPDQAAAMEHCRSLENLARADLFADEVRGLMFLDDVTNLTQSLMAEIDRRVSRPISTDGKQYVTN